MNELSDRRRSDARARRRRRRYALAFGALTLVFTVVLAGMSYAIVQARNANEELRFAADRRAELVAENRKRIAENETARIALCARRARLRRELDRTRTLDLAALAVKLDVPLALVLAGRRDDELELRSLAVLVCH